MAYVNFTLFNLQEMVYPTEKKFKIPAKNISTYRR